MIGVETPPLLRKLIFGAPVVMIRTYGAFARDPLYNNLQLRKVKVSARMEYLLSPEEIREKYRQMVKAANKTFRKKREKKEK